MEHFTVHGPGDVQGKKVELDDELLEITADTYALADTGRRLYDSAFISRAKGRDKSGHAARIVMLEAFGPCRFDGWAKGGEVYSWRDFRYEYRPGEPMGRSIVYPFIRCLATEETQAGNTYDNVYFNLTEGPLAEGLPANAAGLTRTLLPGGGEIVPSTAANASKDGGKETFVVFDETHLYVLPELRGMYATVRRNMGAKRKASEPWSLETSTMYQTGENSVAEDSHRLAEQIREGKVRRSRFLFDHREAPPDVDLTDEESLREALADVYGPFIDVMDVDRVISEIWDPRNHPNDSRRYYLNTKSSSRDTWMTEPEWAGCADPLKVVADRDTVVLGFDGSKGRVRGVADSTALVGCRVFDGHVFEIGMWEQPQGASGRGWQIPRTEVDAAVRSTFGRYNVVGFYADPAGWTSEIGQWEAAFHARLKVKATREHPIEFWITSGRSAAVTRAVETFYTTVVDKGLTHDGSYALTRHILNADRSVERNKVWIVKPDDLRKIDAAWASILAWQARLDAVAAGVGQQSSFVPYRIR